MCGKIKIFLAHSRERLQTRTRAIPLLSLFSHTLGQMGKADCRQRLCTFAKANGKKPFYADNQAISKNCENELLHFVQRSSSRKSFFGFFRIFCK